MTVAVGFNCHKLTRMFCQKSYLKREKDLQMCLQAWQFRSIHYNRWSLQICHKGRSEGSRFAILPTALDSNPQQRWKRNGSVDGSDIRVWFHKRKMKSFALQVGHFSRMSTVDNRSKGTQRYSSLYRKVDPLLSPRSTTSNGLLQRHPAVSTFTSQVTHTTLFACQGRGIAQLWRSIQKDFQPQVFDNNNVFWDAPKDSRLTRFNF